MQTAPEARPEAPEGIPQVVVVQQAPAEPVYTDAQLAEMQAIPSRAILEDGAKNPFYNPRMDPGSDRWQPYEYFKRQPRVSVFVYPDPECPDLEVFSMSINGFTLPCYPNKVNEMPADFVDLLRQRNHQFDVIERGLVSREDGEGRLTLTVGGSPQVKPFTRRIVN